MTASGSVSPTANSIVAGSDPIDHIDAFMADPEHPGAPSGHNHIVASDLLQSPKALAQSPQALTQGFVRVFLRVTA